MGTVIRHAGEHQRCAVVLQDDVFVLEYMHAETPNFVRPRALTGVVLVIAGDEIGTMPRGQAGQWRGMSRQLLHGAVDQVPGYRNHICVQRIDSTHDPLYEPTFDRRTYVYVADLCDRKAVQSLRKVEHWNSDLDDAGSAPRANEPGQRHQKSKHQGELRTRRRP